MLRGFYAHQDTRTPFVINVGQNVLNIVLAFVLVGRYDILGLALALAISYAVCALWALQVLAYKVPGFPLRAVLRSIWRIVVAAVDRRRADVARRQPGRRPGRDRRVRPGRRRRRRRRRRLRRRARPAARPRAGGAAIAAAGSPGGDSGLSSSPMFKLAKKWWKYLTAKLTGSFNERADPKVQLEQAIAEAQNQHRRLKEQAANVIANQKQSELRLNAKMTELEKLNANARQALIMADDAAKAGDAAKSQQYGSAAETIANQLIQVEKDVESLKSMVFESTQASDQAKAAVAQNSRLLQEKLAEKSKLLSQLDQAKMQEEMNTAMAQLNESVGADVPSLSEVQEKIQARYAKAKATSELNEASVTSRVLEVEQATANVEAQSRLSELRAELGLGGAAKAEVPASTEQPAPRRSNPPPDALVSVRMSGRTCSQTIRT